uniref:Uncharacterized protein n=1 Tax=Theileria annulata TaxID=5874 RepID=A0A3B0NK25_THEAN
MEPKNEFKSSNSKSSRNENFSGFYNLGSGSLERLETRVPDDVNDYLSQFSLKSYISQIKSVRSSNDFDLNKNKYDKNESVKSSDTFNTKPLTKYERLQKLEKSLNGIQSNVELKRSTILEDIYQKINNLENKITDSESSSGKKMDLISKKIERIEKTIEMVNTKHEEVLNEKADAIDNICEKFHNSLTQEQENWREEEKNILNSVKGQIESVKQVLTR